MTADESQVVAALRQVISAEADSTRSDCRANVAGLRGEIDRKLDEHETQLKAIQAAVTLPSYKVIVSVLAGGSVLGGALATLLHLTPG